MSSTIESGMGAVAFAEDFDEIEATGNISSYSDLVDLNYDAFREPPSEQIDEFYQYYRDIIINFEEVIEEFANTIDKETIKESLDEVEKQEEKIEKSFAEIGNLFADVEESLIEDLNSRETFLLAEKFFGISCIFLKRTLESTEELAEELENLSDEEIEERAEKRKENLGLGLLVSYQPPLTAALILADQKGDREFIEKYRELIEKYANRIATNAPELYLDVMDSSKISLKTTDVKLEF